MKLSARSPFLVAAAAAVFVTACAPGRREPSYPESPGVSLRADGGRRVDADVLVAAAPYTVLVFFASDCHVLVAHEPRLRALHDAYGGRGVQFVAIDSEVNASPERDADEARRRGYTFPVLVDPGARLASALQAKYSSYVVVVDPHRRVRYSGGIDSDGTHLHEGAQLYLRDALDDLLANREPRRAKTEGFGCALRTW